MNEICSEVSKQVLTVSVGYKPPKGGIAQVISVYSEMYSVFNHVSTSSEGNIFYKFIILMSAIAKFIYFCLFKSIRIVHVHGASYNSFYRKRIFIILAKIMGKKVVYHVHGAEYKKFFKEKPGRVKSLFNRVDCVVALSDSWKFFFENDVGHGFVSVIENVVARPVLSEEKKDGLVHFLFLGVMGQRKGIYDLLEVLAENFDFLRLKAKFHIAGNGEIREVKRRIDQLGLNELVVFEGWAAGQKKASLLNVADVYILPSYNEGLPVSILEAMSYGLPIISTPVGGIPEVVSENNGVLVKPGDKKAIAIALKRMIEDDDFRGKAGRSSYSKITSYFPEEVSKKLTAIYFDLLN